MNVHLKAATKTVAEINGKKRVVLENGSIFDCDMVIIATPAPVAIKLLEGQPLHVLAGDSLGLYGTDGAAYSGAIAARQILNNYSSLREIYCTSE